MKNLAAMLRERKEKDAQEQGQDVGTTQLGMVGLCGAIPKQTKKPGDLSTQYLDISINGRAARAMVDTGAEANFMTELLEAGHIRPSKAPYGAPVLLQKKKDGSLRL